MSVLESIRLDHKLSHQIYLKAIPTNIHPVYGSNLEISVGEVFAFNVKAIHSGDKFRFTKIEIYLNSWISGGPSYPIRFIVPDASIGVAKSGETVLEPGTEVNYYTLYPTSEDAKFLHPGETDFLVGLRAKSLVYGSPYIRATIKAQIDLDDLFYSEGVYSDTQLSVGA
jgi:hypothetical protein